MSTASVTTSPALIGLDWGTSSLRAFLFDSNGAVLERRQSSHGITRLPVPGEEGFAMALAQLVGDWMQVQVSVSLPMLASGMVGSAQGWREAAYVSAPCRPEQLAQNFCRVPLNGVDQFLPNQSAQSATESRILNIVPGVIAHPSGDLPNVMRGEETQILGALDAVGQSSSCGNALVILPGTHSKWVTVEDGAIADFHTFMTGEVFAALREHTILGRTMDKTHTQFERAAFERGLAVAASDAGSLGLLGNIFSTRSLGLVNALSPVEQGDYLSGLLIGHEVQAMVRQQIEQKDCWLIGEESLCQRYMLALELAGLCRPTVVADATERGLWRLARAAGLVG